MKGEAIDQMSDQLQMYFFLFVKKQMKNFLFKREASSTFWSKS
jgi:hypothetical protein